MATLSYGSKGPQVKALQDKLDTVRGTRLPRLHGDSDYGPLTMARVMEFQYKSGLGTDGAAGPQTTARLDTAPGPGNPPAGRVIVVDLINERLRAFENGSVRLDVRPIKGGTLSDPSTRGVFMVDPARRYRNHTSSKYPTPPGNMDFSLFYHGAEAIHKGNPRATSHGCIHVDAVNAERLFVWAGSSVIMVIVLKTSR